MSEHKRENAAPGSGLASALSEAQSIIEAARKRAAEVLSEAEKKYQEARETGYREGYDRGLLEASRKAVRLIEESTEVAEKLSTEGAKLAMAIAGTIIGEHIRVAPEAACNIAMRAIQESVIGDTVTLVVNPEDEEVLRASTPQLRRVAGNATLHIETDPSLARGGCLVRTDFGEIDATISTLLQTIRERLGLIEDER